MKKTNYTVPLTIAGTLTGVVVPLTTIKKNINMKYAVCAKEQLKPFMTKEFDKTHKYNCVPRFSKNPITHIKELKDSLHNVECDLAELVAEKVKLKSAWNNKREISLLSCEKESTAIKILLNEYKILFLEINSKFKTAFYQKLVKKVTAGIVIWSTIGTIAGLVLDKITKKQDK